MQRSFFTAVVAALAVLVAVQAWAQTYPNRPLRVVVAAATGGPDLVARIVAAELTTQLGQSFFVEKDFAPVTNLTSSGGLFLAVHPSLPVNTLKEFVEYARRPDAKLAYSTPGVGNNSHLATEVFSKIAGISMTHVPYKGGGPAAAALVSGEVQAMLVSPAPIMPHYKGNRVRLLAYTGEKRNAAVPDVPLMKEAGVAYTYDGGWFGHVRAGPYAARNPGEDRGRGAHGDEETGGA